MKVEATAFSARARRSLPPGGMQALQESVKEKQTKAKEAREARQKLIGPEHKYILTLVRKLLSTYLFHWLRHADVMDVMFVALCAEQWILYCNVLI